MTLHLGDFERKRGKSGNIKERERSVFVPQSDLTGSVEPMAEKRDSQTQPA